MRRSVLFVVATASLAASCRSPSSPPQPPISPPTKPTVSPIAPSAPKPTSAEAPASAVTPDEPSRDSAERDAALERRAELVVDAFANDGARFLPGGARIAYRSTRDGAWRAYFGEIAHPEAPPVRLPSDVEQVAFAAPATASDGPSVDMEALPGPVRELRVAPSGSPIALIVDAGGHDELRLFDAKARVTEPKPALPRGRGALGGFSSDGKKLSFAWSTPSSPSDVFSLTTRTGTIERLRNESRPSLAALEPIETSIAPVPSPIGAAAIPVVVLLPAASKTAPRVGGDGARARLPALVLVHGRRAAGAWDVAARFFASLGYCVVEWSAERSNGEESARTLAAIGAWIAAQPWGDGGRLVLWGDECGATTVLATLARDPGRWNAGVVCPSAPSECAASTPFTDVESLGAPLFVHRRATDAGDAPDRIVASLRARGVPVEYMVAPAEHDADERRTTIELLARSARFLEHALGAAKR